MTRLLAGAVVAFCLATVGGNSQALASAGCSALTAGAWNVSQTEPSGHLPTETFSAGDKITFVLGVSGSGKTRPRAVNVIEPIGYSAGNVEKIGPATFSYTVVTNHSSLADTLDRSLFNGWTVTLTAACTSIASGNTDNSQRVRSPLLSDTKNVAANAGTVPNGTSITGIPYTFTMNSVGEVPSRVVQRSDDVFPALGPASGRGYTKALPLVYAPDWNAWAEVRGTGFDQNDARSDTHGTQLNVTGGVGRKISPDLLVGVLTGYERVNFTTQSLVGKTVGDGGALGAYAAYRFVPNWSADGAISLSNIWYTTATSTSSGSFTGSRWLGSGGLTGDYRFTSFVLEPSTRVYVLQEAENAWADSLGMMQAARNFSESLVSTGGKLTYPWQAAGMQISPYLGSYGDYRFSSNNALPVDVPFVGLKDGWSARATTGVTFATGGGGPSLTLGGELGGIGAGYDIWSANARVNWPF